MYCEGFLNEFWTCVGQTWAMSGVILGHVWDMSRILFGHVWDMSRIIFVYVWDMFWVHLLTYFGHVRDMSGTCFAHVWDMFWICFGRVFSGRVLDVLWPKCSLNYSVHSGPSYGARGTAEE